jgi:hypothetical protein
MTITDAQFSFVALRLGNAFTRSFWDFHILEKLGRWVSEWLHIQEIDPLHAAID